MGGCVALGFSAHARTHAHTRPVVFAGKTRCRWHSMIDDDGARARGFSIPFSVSLLSVRVRGCVYSVQRERDERGREEGKREGDRQIESFHLAAPNHPRVSIRIMRPRVYTAGASAAASSLRSLALVRV